MRAFVLLALPALAVTIFAKPEAFGAVAAYALAAFAALLVLAVLFGR